MHYTSFFAAWAGLAHIAAAKPAHRPVNKPLCNPRRNATESFNTTVPDSTGRPAQYTKWNATGHPLKNGQGGFGSTQVPYSDGLTLGQGYNTYLQAGCMNGAVDVTGTGGTPGQVKITYHADQITEYSQIAKELEISASLGIKYLDNSAEISGKMLDKSTFKDSLLTYIVRADVIRQPSSDHKYAFKWNHAKNPHQRYCDRFISDFVEGGALYAQVSIQSTESSKKDQLAASAKVAFGMFGVDVTVTTEMKQASEFLSKHSKVTSEMFWVGAPPNAVKSQILAQLADAQSDQTSLLDIKTLSDRFIAEAGEHQWKRYAIVERYDQVFNWADEFTPLDYSNAIEQTWAVFDDYASYSSMMDMLKTINVPDSLKQKQQELRAAVLKAKDAVKTWITSVAENPRAAESKPSYDAPDQFYGNILDAFSTNYTVQSIEYEWKNKDYTIPRSSSLIDERLRTDVGKVTSLFSIQGFSFPGIIGTSKYTFGNRPDMPWWVVTSDAPLPESYQEQSHVWVLNNKTSSFSRPVHVYAVIDTSDYYWNRLDIQQNLSPEDKATRLQHTFFTKA